MGGGKRNAFISGQFVELAKVPGELPTGSLEVCDVCTFEVGSYRRQRKFGIVACLSSRDELRRQRVDLFQQRSDGECVASGSEACLACREFGEFVGDLLAALEGLAMALLADRRAGGPDGGSCGGSCFDLRPGTRWRLRVASARRAPLSRSGMGVRHCRRATSFASGTSSSSAPAHSLEAPRPVMPIFELRRGRCRRRVMAASSLRQFSMDKKAAGVEHGLEQLLTFFGSAAQELGELALRQQDHLLELVGVEAHQVVDQCGDLTCLAGQ